MNSSRNICRNLFRSAKLIKKSLMRNRAEQQHRFLISASMPPLTPHRPTANTRAISRPSCVEFCHGLYVSTLAKFCLPDKGLFTFQPAPQQFHWFPQAAHSHASATTPLLDWLTFYRSGRNRGAQETQVMLAMLGLISGSHTHLPDFTASLFVKSSFFYCNVYAADMAFIPQGTQVH